MVNETPNLDRRTMLKTAAAVATAGTTVAGLAACSDPSENSAPGGTAVPDPAAGSTVGIVLGATADIPVGGGKVFTEHKVVVTCPSAGTYKAFSAICTHRGCEVNAVEDGVIKCPCHGSRFNAADGSVKNGPAPTALPVVPVIVHDGRLVLDT